ARSGQPRDHGEAFARKVERDILEVVGTSAPDPYYIHCHSPAQTRIISGVHGLAALACYYSALRLIPTFLMSTESPSRMTPLERRSSVALASLFACRMLGLFLLLPVFAVAAQGLPGGNDPARVGLALGMYGLTQAFMQIPFGLASDRWGRKPVVLFGLVLFVLGSVVCALAGDIFWVTIGRAVQGAGAISAAVTAWLADSTRDEVRTKAMAMVGSSIGLSFAVSLVAAPLVVGWGGLSGLFWVIALLGVAALAVALWAVPVPQTLTVP